MLSFRGLGYGVKWRGLIISKAFGYRYIYIFRVPNFDMKVMKSVDKKVGDVTYYKYKINLPKKIVEENNLADKEFDVKFEDNKIILEEKKD